MVEAKFQFRSTGDVDVSELQIDYGEIAPSEEWCNLPYVIKLNDPSDTLYELRFPLAPFNKPESGKLVRTCTVYGPIYVLPKLNVPIINISLTIKQLACIDKLNCEELINQIDVFVNSDDGYIHPDGGLVEIERQGYEPFFTETLVSIIDKSTGSGCTWASFDEDGNLFVQRRRFDNNNTEDRGLEVTYRYDYTYDGEIDDNACYLEYTGDLWQRPRGCEDKDVEVEIINADFEQYDERDRSLGEIFHLVGLDSNTFEIKSINDIRATGTAFDGIPNIVEWSDSRVDYVINVGTNSDTSDNLLEDKIGYLSLTYNNKFLEGCTFEADITLKVHGISCDEILSKIAIAIKLNDEDEYITAGNIPISFRENRFSVYIIDNTGEGYAGYFDIDENKCEFDNRCTLIDSYTFKIPENTDSYGGKTYSFKFNCGIIDEQYSEYHVFSCNKSQSFVFTQEAYQYISEIGDIGDKYDEVCEGIEQLPSELLEYQQDCGYLGVLTNNNFYNEQACGSIEPLNMSDIAETRIESIGGLDDGTETPTIEEE